MSADRDTTRIVRSWLQEDAHEDADRVLNLVLDQLDTTPQRRATWWPVRRFSDMNTFAKVAVAAAAVLIVVFLGIRYLPATNDPGNVPVATATPTPSASPTPVAGLPPSGSVDAGTYLIEVPDSPVAVQLTIAQGWTSGDWYIMNPPAFDRSISFWTVGNVYADPCDLDGSLPDPAIGPTVDDMVAALDAQANSDMSAPIDVVIGGYSGKRFEMAVPETVLCNPPLTMWVDALGNPGRSIERPFADTILVVDVDGQRVVIVGSSTSPSASVTIDEVIDSIEFVAP